MRHEESQDERMLSSRVEEKARCHKALWYFAAVKSTAYTSVLKARNIMQRYVISRSIEKSINNI